MSQPLHRPLGDKKNEVRLLHLDTTGQGQHTLVSNVPFRQQQTRFAALSYPWGQNSIACINVNGRNWEVTTNLAQALEEVIKFWKATYPLRDRDLYLWTDQICINQSDNDEKSHQVGLMRDIYQQAEEVLVWLPLPASIRNNFDKWKDWYDWHHKQVALNARYLSKNHEMVYATGLVTAGDYPCDSAEDQLDRDVLIAWTSIHTILESAWWERAWVYQEFMGPDRATFLAHGLWAPWQEMYALITLYFEHRESHANFCTAKSTAFRARENNLLKERVDPGCCCACLNGCQHCMEDCAHFGKKTSTGSVWYNLCCICFKASDAGEKVLKQRDIRNGTNLDLVQRQKAFLRMCMEQHLKGDENWQMANFVLKHKADQVERGTRYYESLSELLRHGRSCKSTEVKDKVYAFLGVANPAYKITPDYGLSDSEVFTETTKAIIEQEQSLDVLAIARENTRLTPTTDSLSSWVPDWSDRDNLNSDYRNFLREIQFPVHNCRATKDTKPITLIQGRILNATGIYFDRLSRVTEERPHAPFRRFMTETGREVSTVSRAKVGDEVWVFLGAKEPFTMRQNGGCYVILGHAMLREAGEISPIMNGALIDQLDNGAAVLHQIAII